MILLEIFSLVVNVALFSYIISRWWRERKYAKPVGENWNEEVTLLEEEGEGDWALLRPVGRARIRPVLVEITPLEEEEEEG
jgi:hypothetical protein